MIESVFDLAAALAAATSGWSKKLRAARDLLRLAGQPHSVERDRQAVTYHYDVSNDFYVWRLFMSGSAHGFTHGRLNVYQALLVKPDAAGESGLPLTRAEWYQA